MARTKGSKDTVKRKFTPTSSTFKKGNKKGVGTLRSKSPKVTLEKVSNAKIDKALVDRYLTMNSHLSVGKLMKRLQIEEVSVLEGMLIKGLLKAYRSGDPHNINFFLDRLIGKVPTKIAHSLEQELEGKTDEELIELKAKYSQTLVAQTADIASREPLASRVAEFEKETFLDADTGEILTAKEHVEAARKK